MCTSYLRLQHKRREGWMKTVDMWGRDIYVEQETNTTQYEVPEEFQDVNAVGTSS